MRLCRLHRVHAAPRLPATLVVLLAGCNGPGSDPLTDPRPPVVDGGTDTSLEPVPPVGTPWERDELQSPGSITFNEVLYAPASGASEWVELHNPMAITMDLSGWALGGGITYAFPEGTTLAADGYLVVAADPAQLASALGPFDGALSDSGERLELRNNGGRLIDTVAYADDDPWPVAPDGSGASLAKLTPDAASDHAENWRGSAELGGTPGAANVLDPLAPSTTVELVPLASTWSYDVSGAYPAVDWAEVSYDDAFWATGDAVFYAGAPQEDALATVRVTADNYYAIYLGNEDGSDLRLVGLDPDGDWTTVESFDVTVTPEDHLYIAAWEAPGDNGGPQMVTAEVELPDDVVGTTASSFEWVLGPTDASPGITPPGTAPLEADLLLVLDAAAADGSWAAPAAEASRTSDPWGWATSGSFTDATSFVWGDTFDSDSITNVENTYALFRSVAPLLGPGGATELPAIPTTATFRSHFTFDGDPAGASLYLQCLVDDGAIVYLDGVEVARLGMGSGAVDASTLASAEVGNATESYVEISADALVRGDNVLAVELHQALADDVDLAFGCSLTAQVAPHAAGPTIVFNEVGAPSDTAAWVELSDVADGAEDTTGLVLASSAGSELVLPAGSLDPGAIAAVELGFPVDAGDVLYLYSADRGTLLDAVRVGDGLRGRADGGGAWRVPSEATPGEPNVIETTDDVVINEIQYHRAPVSKDGEPVTERTEEWIELYNRGEEAVDLDGWQIVDAVAYALPSGTILEPGGYLVVASDAAALQAEHPDIDVVGDYSGHLDNGSDRVLLLDGRGNPADEVRYFDGGRWPAAADGGGSSLELRDPRADNAAPEAWAASDEAARAEWVSYRYRGEATASAVGPDGQWEELVLGLLDAGEVLIDDVSVIQDPGTAPVELVQDGAFDQAGAHWRLLGNHRHGEIVADPDDASNPVLRVVATGAEGHMHNHVETTLLRPIQDRQYEIAFRARWVSGSNQLNTRLYFNRLPRTTRVTQPDVSGTPGAANSTYLSNEGPTFDDLRQDVAVPAPSQPVSFSLSVQDPDGVDAVTLWSSVDGGAFSGQPMAEGEPGTWSALLPGQAAGSVIQVYVEAEDALGERATFPAAGPDSRALVKVDDGKAASNGLHNFRILVTGADSDWLHDDVNLMSDDLVGATVVYDESQVFYDVGVRTKGSERGRPETLRLGYGVSFHSEQPFRGSHASVLIDRSEGVGYGQREVLMNLVMTHAGSVTGEYNDLAQALTPLAEHTGPAELQLDRFSGLVLDAQFPDGASGPLFEYELIYYPTTTDDGTPEGLKLPQPDSVVGTALTDLGDDPEAYRWDFLLQSNEREDDYDELVDTCQVFGTATDLAAQGDAVIDVDEWLRAFAFATLSGAIDNYGGDGSAHNARFYVRPDDRRVLYFPHDLDFYGGSTMAVVGNSDLSRLIADPVNRRAYYGHLNDIIGRAYNEAYLAPWCDEMAELLAPQDFGSHCQFVADRAQWVLETSPDAVMVQYPPVGFEITTNGGADFTVDSLEATIEGQGWIDVRQVQLDGATAPLTLTWLDGSTWQVNVPLQPGANDVTLLAMDLEGAVVGTDSVVVTATSP